MNFVFSKNELNGMFNLIFEKLTNQ
ncbi:uncharacterized protein METZ01_LOCUS354791 [marine metagenome]|uniref:Uncharacterized protein n=1 Tax=marine metagenome TaxID=408172 RepID=A0A382RY33_9ZZZZ